MQIFWGEDCQRKPDLCLNMSTTPENNRVSKEKRSHRLPTRARPKQATGGFYVSWPYL